MEGGGGVDDMDYIGAMEKKWKLLQYFGVRV